LIVNGINSILVETRNQKEFGKQLVDLLNDPKKLSKMSQEAIKIRKQLPTLTEYAQQFLEIIKI